MLRVDVEEQMEDPDLPDGALRTILRDLRRYNRWFGGLGPVVREVRRQASRLGSITILDVGGGDGFVLGSVLEALGQPRARGILLERSERIARFAAADGFRVEIGDAAKLPHPDHAFDFVISSLVLHHLGPKGAVEALREMGRVARHGLVVSDLVRSTLAFQVVRCCSPLLGCHPVTLHDGPASIRRTFTMEEWQNIARESGLVGVTCRPIPWFRVLLTMDRR